MTPETRRNVLRYGIAIDLVIVATGAGMLLPATPVLLLLVFGVAVLLSTWKGGWQGGLTALVLSLVVLATMFPPGAGLLALFALAMAVAIGVVVAAMRPRVAESTSLRVDESSSEEMLAARRLDDSPTAGLEAQLAREREEAEREKARLEAERETAERERRELEARAAREREEA